MDFRLAMLKILDENLRKISGIYLDQQGFINHRSKIIQREDIIVFGIDAILTKDADVVIDSGKLSAISRMTRRDFLKQKELYTEDSTCIAKIRDVILDEEWYVVGFTLGRVYIDGPIADLGAITREALSSTLSSNEKMIIDLTIAEDQDLGILDQT